MADNFNLRQFLTENKLTKNAKLLNEISFNGKPVNVGSIEIDGIDTEDYPDFVDAYIIAAEYEDGTPLSEEELLQFEEENYGLVGELVHDRQLYLEEKKQVSSGDMAYTEKAEEGVNESTMTKREKYLTRLVENALGIDDEEEDFINPGNTPEEDINRKNYLKTFGTPPTTVPGEEMVQEKPLPKYENIEKLMQEIEHGTNEAAYKHKMTKMKEVAEMLEARVGSLEEGEGAEFVDTKKVKQMKKDIMTLRKQAEKLEKEYDKKFGEKKSKKEAQTENKIENFNLKKFLVENKLTTNSRLLKEDEGEYGEEQETIYEDNENRILLVYEPVEDGATYDIESGEEGEDMPWYLVNDFHGEDWDVFSGYFERPTDRQIAKDVIDHLGEVDKKGFYLKDFGHIEKGIKLKPDLPTFSSNE